MDPSPADFLFVVVSPQCYVTGPLGLIALWLPLSRHETQGWRVQSLEMCWNVWQLCTNTLTKRRYVMTGSTNKLLALGGVTPPTVTCLTSTHKPASESFDTDGMKIISFTHSARPVTLWMLIENLANEHSDSWKKGEKLRSSWTWGNVQLIRAWINPCTVNHLSFATQGFSNANMQP